VYFFYSRFQKESMTLREVTRAVISLVENASGCAGVENEDESLKTLAASRIARGTNRIHAIAFNPSAIGEPDYLICYQGWIYQDWDWCPVDGLLIISYVAKNNMLSPASSMPNKILNFPTH
jgi:hypothetical protein